MCYEVPKMLFSSPSSYLFHHHFDVLERHALVIVPNDELEEVVAEHLEHHTHVAAIYSRDPGDQEAEAEAEDEAEAEGVEYLKSSSSWTVLSLSLL